MLRVFLIAHWGAGIRLRVSPGGGACTQCARAPPVFRPSSHLDNAQLRREGIPRLLETAALENLLTDGHRWPSVAALETERGAHIHPVRQPVLLNVAN